MRAAVALLFLFALHNTKATLDLQELTKTVDGITDTLATKVQDLKNTATNNFNEFVDTIDFDKVKQLDVLNILPKVQRKVEFGKKLYEQKKNLGQIIIDHKRQKLGKKIKTLQKAAEIKKQALQGLVEKKKELFKEKQNLAQNLLEQKEKIVHALVHEKQELVQDLLDHKKKALSTLIYGPPPAKKVIYISHPPKHHAHKIIHGPPLASHFEDHHHHHHAPKEVYYKEIAPHKLLKVVKPLPYKKVIIHTKIYD